MPRNKNPLGPELFIILHLNQKLVSTTNKKKVPLKLSHMVCGGGDCSSVVKHLPHLGEALGSVSMPAKANQQWQQKLPCVILIRTDWKK